MKAQPFWAAMCSQPGLGGAPDTHSLAWGSARLGEKYRILWICVRSEAHLHICVCFVGTSTWQEHLMCQLIIFNARFLNLQAKDSRNILRTLRILKYQKL